MFELNEVLALVFMLISHELGHGFAASVFNKRITYCLSSNNNPAVRVSGPLNDKEHFFIASSGFVASLIMVPLFGDYIIAVLFCVILSFGDFLKIYKRVLKANDQTDLHNNKP